MTPAWSTSWFCPTPRSSTMRFTARPISRSSPTPKSLFRLVRIGRTCLHRRCSSSWKEKKMRLWGNSLFLHMCSVHKGRKDSGSAHMDFIHSKDCFDFMLSCILLWNSPSFMFVDLWRHWWWIFCQILADWKWGVFSVCAYSLQAFWWMKLVAAFFNKMYYCQCRLWQFMHSCVFTTYGFIYWCVVLWLLLCCLCFGCFFFLLPK